MKKKVKYFVAFFDTSNECVFSRLVSSRSAFEAVASVVLTVSLSVCSDVYSRLKDGGFSVSVRPFVEDVF